jgi:hypothetical protein
MRFTLPAHLTGASRFQWKHDILLDRPLHGITISAARARAGSMVRVYSSRNP